MESEAPVTVLFSDIEGSTDLQSRLGDVAARQMVRAHEAVVRDALAEFGGREIKTIGDGFLVAFSSTRRALDSACAIQRGLAEHDVRVRIGLHAGEVILEGDDIHGATVSAAARIMGMARGGEILVSDLVRQLAGAAGLRFRDRGTVPLKGLEGQWQLHEVVWQPDAVASKATTFRPTSTLVGRNRELDLLRAAVESASAGRGRVVLLAGEPGIGKTSLATETAADAQKRGSHVLWGACWEGGGAPAFWPWIQVLRAHAEAVDDATLAADAGPGASDLLRVVPELAPRLPDASHPPELDPEQARFRLFDAVSSLLCKASARRPLLTVLDDLHWADESSLLLLGFVAAQVATHQVAVVGTYRDTDVGPDHPMAALLHDATRRGQVLSVSGLDADSVAHVMAHAAGTELRHELAVAVHRRTGGNPLFVGEVTRLLAAHNALDADDVSLGVPVGVREVIERRLVRLPQRCIELLTVAAVVGEEFGLDVVAAAASVEMPTALEHVEAAMEAGAARDAGVMGRFRFAHALFREVLYEGLGTIARARLHLQVAEALETRFLERGDVSAAELANHFVEAALTGEHDRAIRYATLASEQATRSLAYGEAVTHLERALAVLDVAGGGESDRAELLLRLGAALWRNGDRGGAHDTIERAVALARRSGRNDVLAHAALAMRRLGGVSGAADNERVLLLEEARAALGDEETPLRARVLAGLAQELYHTWLHRDLGIAAQALAEEAVEIARRLDDPPTLAAALLAQHDVLWLPGKETERYEIATELRERALATGDREVAVEALLLQSTALTELSDRRAIALLEDFVRDAEDLRQPHWDYLAATRRVELAIIKGDPEAIDRHLEPARELAKANQEPDEFLVESAQVMARDLLLDDRRRSIPYAQRGYRNRAYDELTVVTECLALIEEGHPEKAGRLLAELDLEEMASRYLHNYGWLYLLAAVGEAAAMLRNRARIDEVEAMLAPHADVCIVIAGNVSFRGSVSHYLGLMHAARGETDAARAAFEAALAAYDRLGATGWAERTRRELGKLDDAPAAAGEAGNELRRHGSAWTLSYRGHEARVKDVKGLRDLALLLAAPGQEVPAAELIAQGLSGEKGADAVLDERARREFRQRLADLDEDLDAAETAHDLARIAAIKAERDAIAHELAAALGLGGRARNLGDLSERARKAVSARIRDAIGRVREAHPELGDHLRASIRTGTFCAYEPVSPTTWRVTDDTVR